MANRPDLIFKSWAEWQAHQKRDPRWVKFHYPLGLALRWGVSKSAIYAALDRGALVCAQVTGPMGGVRRVIPEFSAVEYEANHLGRRQGVKV